MVLKDLAGKPDKAGADKIYKALLEGFRAELGAAEATTRLSLMSAFLERVEETWARTGKLHLPTYLAFVRAAWKVEKQLRGI
jgi:hypothetical protein